MAAQDNSGLKQSKLDLDMSYDSILFYLEAVLPEVGTSTRAHLARVLAESHLREQVTTVDRAASEARINELMRLPAVQGRSDIDAYIQSRLAQLQRSQPETEVA